MMKISHEVPLDLLESSLDFNDYQYCLPHYYIKYPQYRSFFLNYRKKNNSFIILDNGLFEGEVFPEAKLIEIIAEIKPNIFIVPDAWNDYVTTVDNAKKWLFKYRPTQTKLMMVLQGKTYSELSEALHLASRMGYDHFGINHSSVAYDKMYPHSNPIVSKMMGRIMVFNKLIEEDTHNQLKSSYVHFLGCSTPTELIYLNNKQHISSIDSSNPIIMGLINRAYTKDPILYKPQDKIEVFMEKDLALEEKELILYNINQFKDWCNNF